MTLYFEDLAVGRRFATAPATLSEAQIVEYAEIYDPQPIHIDRAAAAKGHYGGIIASGHQTLAIGFAQWIRLGHYRDSSLGGPALDEVRWSKPVRPGDMLETTVEVVEARPSASRPDRGIVVLGFTIATKAAGTVCSYRTTTFVKRRPAA
ncbi:MAG: acyl dehydratase [Alphaproteobacteria bacterium]|nr:acyl dehydratase [Alphaproteobacteria bacterium]